jgi:hypothetical protein
VSDTKTASWIAALERARAELSRALSADPRWRTPRGAASNADWASYDKAFWANPVYRCWAQLNEAIQDLRRQAQADATAGRRRVSLRDVLEHIPSDAAPLQGSEPRVMAPEAKQADPPEAAPSEPQSRAEAGHPPPEPGEATVSFVIREPARSAPVAGDNSKASAAKKPTPPAPEPNASAEAEVVIVPRRR